MGTQGSDLAPLAGLTALQSLDLGTQVSDLAPLAGLTALQSLYLMGTQVSDLAPLAGLTAMQTLDLTGTQVSDLAPLARLTALQSLYLMGTQVSDLAPLAGLTALRRLHVDGTRVSDLTPVTALSALESLGLDGTAVSDLSPLVQMTGLMEAACRNPERDRAGLHYSRTPASRRPPFSRFVELPPAGCTVETINELRRRQGLAEHIPEGYAGLASPSGVETSADTSATLLEPLPGVPSAFGFRLSGSRIELATSPANWPVFPLPTSESDHKNRLEVSRTLARDLASDLMDGRFNARRDYVDGLTKYVDRLPQRPGDGNILLADAEARTLRTMFAADVNELPVGFASRLRTLLEQHIGLRVYYPEIEHFYHDVQRGRIEQPLPLDAVQGFVRGVQDNTPDIFDPPVNAALASGSALSQEPQRSSDATPPLASDQPRPPPDPLGELDPRKARDFTFAGAVNSLWGAFLKGEKVNKALEGWKHASKVLRPHAQRILEWLRTFLESGDGAPPLPPDIAV